MSGFSEERMKAELVILHGEIVPVGCLEQMLEMLQEGLQICP